LATEINMSAAAGAEATGSTRLGPELLMTLGGFGTSLLVVFANLVIARSVGFDFLSLSFWFVIPAGAFLGGFAAASGYYFIARLTQIMPSRRLLFDMVVVGLSTWFLYSWLDYYTLVLDDGTRVRDLVSFWQYWVIATESTQLTIGRASSTTGELGNLGYVREALQAVAFMLGGFATYGHLTASEVCAKCRRYAKVRKLLDTDPPEVFDATLQQAGLSLPGLVNDATTVLGNRPLLGLDLNLLECPLCHDRWIRPALVTRAGDNTDRLRLGAYVIDGNAAGRLEQISISVAAAKKAEKKKRK
jgi:hypothetical protein